jgi:hypothetical protein
MNFKNEYPKKEITIVTNVKVGSLIADNNVEIHFRDYKGYLDTIQHIILEGPKNAWFEIKHDFLYDTLIGTIKDFYSDSFDRKLKVTIK